MDMVAPICGSRDNGGTETEQDGLIRLMECRKESVHVKWSQVERLTPPAVELLMQKKPREVLEKRVGEAIIPAAQWESRRAVGRERPCRGQSGLAGCQ